jgi:hypothetical protein
MCHEHFYKMFQTKVEKYNQLMSMHHPVLTAINTLPYMFTTFNFKGQAFWVQSSNTCGKNIAS